MQPDNDPMETKYPRRLFPGFAGGLGAGVWIMWSYTQEASRWVPEETMHELWIRVPTLSAGIGLAAAFGVSEVVGRWRVDGRNAWFLFLGLAAFMSALSVAATLIGGAYFGSMPIPYVGAGRLALGIIVPLFLFSLDLARQQGAGWWVAFGSTVLLGGIVPIFGALIIAPFFSLRAIRDLARELGIGPALAALGFMVGVGYGLTLAAHVFCCRWWAQRSE